MAVPVELSKAVTDIGTDKKPELVTAASASAQHDQILALPGFLPLELRTYVSLSLTRVDSTLVQLQRLFTQTANVEALLATLNYALYMVTYSSSSSSGAGSAAAALNDFIGAQRNTLRLLQLPILYSVLRGLLAASTDARGDRWVWRVNVAQCMLYIAYQALENVAHLVDLKILSSSTVPTALYRDRNDRLWLHSNRFWLAGVSCDLVRLGREAMLERRRRRTESVNGEGKERAGRRTKEELTEVDTRWRHELQVASCTWPICLHASVEGGLSRFNDGVMGVLGVLANWETLRLRWEETKSG